MKIAHSEISIRGKTIRVPSVQVQGRTVAASGRWLRIATVRDEDWIDMPAIGDVGAFVDALRDSGLRADVFSCVCVDGDVAETPGARFEGDNVAVIDTSDFKAWWEGLPQEARKNTRRAAKRGVTVSVVPFDDELVRGIKSIYDEAPVRQGRRFWHYGKPLELVRKENGTYVDRSVFIGAFFEGQLIGFIKWVRVGDVARIMQILSMNAHQDKRPIIALVAKAVEVCEQQGCRQLIYGKYTYGNKDDASITEFKRRLGFRPMEFMRCHVALTSLGRLALQLGLHRGLHGALPAPVLGLLLQWRSKWLNRRETSGQAAAVVTDDKDA
jgi:hypothetical protein